MKIEHKWYIPEDLLKNAFDNLGIEKEYYSIFMDRANDYLNDLAKQFEPEPPDKEDFVDSIENASDWIIIYSEQIKLGLSEPWSSTYAGYRVSWSKDESAYEAYNKVCNDVGEEKADRDLAIFAQSLCDDPIFIKSYIHIFNNNFKDAENRAHEYTELYKSLIEKGKSPIYAKQYALQIQENDPAYCELYASKFEESINKGRDEDNSRIIANAYKNLHYDHWPEDNYFLGIEAHKGYMQGFEYAIDNGIDSPQTFAEEYKKAYLHTLSPDEEEPPCKTKGKYDDIISKLLADKT